MFNFGMVIKLEIAIMKLEKEIVTNAML